MNFDLLEIDDKKLWLKLSGSITYYFKLYNFRLSNEEIWKDYKKSTFDQYEGDYYYLEKQSLKYVKVSYEMVEKTKKSFIERLEKRRSKKLEEVKAFKDNIIDFKSYKK